MSLLAQLKARIAADGPISVADYMSECLLHPDYGYYATRDPFGQLGDFTTAPEISQMFGEMLGLCLAQTWLDQGAPETVTLAELGPGRGTLMRDILRAARAVPAFKPHVCLIEASAHLRTVQAETLADHDITWVDHIDDLPPAPLFLVANEFFDALPIRQFQRDGASWREIRIGVQDDVLSRGLGQAQGQPVLDHRLEDTQDGDIVELCTPAITITQALSHKIAQYGGAAVLIDYGDWRSLGDTWQAMKRHAPVPVLDAPGTADLTAHVDFECLAEAARIAGAQHSRITPQGVFLERLGITDRAQALAQNLADTDLDGHIAAHRRLTHPAEMGNLFKVMGIAPINTSMPPGLEI
ncbi:MAG: SAM-dependent methyltransferase [Aliishimia sp.]